jgi:hypothetical protein
MWKRPTVVAVISAIAVAMGMSTMPRTASAEEGDRCGGNVTPVCRKIEVCAQMPGTDTKVCTRDFYYFPNAE